jgi:hypothetical protein
MGKADKSAKRRQQRVKGEDIPRQRPPFLWVLVFVLGAGLGIAAWKILNPPHRAEIYKSRPQGTVTFTKDIAPIVFENCSTCHRPGQSGPFPLIQFADVKKHGKEIAEVTQKRYMPPWLPEPGDFVGERRLTVDQIGLIQQWVAEGSVEGASENLPTQPKWRDGWQLGTPDLVVTMPVAYTLPADGKDLYRNFVIPIPTTERRFVKAIEFDPGNRSVHHVFFLFDRNRRARQQLKVDDQPGFPGMSLPQGASSPQGVFLSWQPGKVPSVAEDMAWTLEKETDLVLQVHMQPTGKSESVRCSLAFYFTDTPSSKTMIKLGLSDLSFDIPAGAESHLVEDTFKLPVDAHVLALLPHAHYLGKELRGFATLSDGTKKSLLHIKQWDFNWQNDYRFKTPVFLPKGSTLTMQYTYDNSTNNVRNPNHPPKPVQYGVQTTDEMAELWIQLQLRGAEDLPGIEQALLEKIASQNIAYSQYRLRLNPNDAEAHVRLGEALLATGRKAEAFDHFQKAVLASPNYDEPHYQLGLMFRVEKQLDRARQEFETTIRLNPKNSRAHGNLGFIFASLGNLDQAVYHLQSAVNLNPNDTLASSTLAEILRAKATGPK